MPKLRLAALLLTGIFSLLIWLGNKNGRASQEKVGNTGAPGDEMQGGQPKTCINCHNGGAITATVSISMLDSLNQAVSQYIPGKKYTTRVTINATGSNLNGYGFQMIGLRNSDHADLDGFSDVNPNNYKIVTIPGGRTYAEHNNVSTSNTFDVRWTAPPSGTGSLTFYAAGNGVNANGATTGDGSGKDSLQLTEFSSSATDPFGALPEMKVFPNPWQPESAIHLSAIPLGAYTLAVCESSGKLIWSSLENFTESEVSLFLPAEKWPPGIYILTLSGTQKRSSVKILKL